MNHEPVLESPLCGTPALAAFQRESRGTSILTCRPSSWIERAITFQQSPPSSRPPRPGASHSGSTTVRLSVPGPTTTPFHHRSDRRKMSRPRLLRRASAVLVAAAMQQHHRITPRLPEPENRRTAAQQTSIRERSSSVVLLHARQGLIRANQRVQSGLSLQVTLWLVDVRSSSSTLNTAWLDQRGFTAAEAFFASNKRRCSWLRRFRASRRS